MNIFEKLAELADALDKKGLYAEASEIDGIIKIAQGDFEFDYDKMLEETEREENKELLDRVNRAGKSDKITKIQNRYNQKLKELAWAAESAGANPQAPLSRFPAPLNPDGAWGPKTDAAWKAMDKLDRAISGYKGMAFTGQVGKPIGEFDFGKDKGMAPGMTPSGVAGQTGPTKIQISGPVFEAAGKLADELKGVGKSVDPNKLAEKIEYLVGQGESLRSAVDKVRLHTMGA